MGSMRMSPAEAENELIYQHIMDLEQGRYDTFSDAPFLVAHSTKLPEQNERWRSCLPNVQPYYGQSSYPKFRLERTVDTEFTRLSLAVKCNSDVHLLRSLHNMGVNFDCASLEEIRLVLELGIDPSRIIFAHPCKPVSALEFASQQGVQLTTFDNGDELDKVKAHCPKMGLLLRIFAQDGGAKVCLGDKFGAPWETTNGLLKKAKRLQLNILGVSFHIGSGASDPQAFATAVKQARCVFDEGARLGFNMKILDIGGGFQDSNFEPMAGGLRRAMDQVFGDLDATFMGEPGRFYAAPYYTMVCRVISRREQSCHAASRHVPDMLYQNDGVYGCFSSKWAESGVFAPIHLPQRRNIGGPRQKGTHRYSIWGPTCDSVDLVADEVVFSSEVRIGDWLKYPDMGAYTTCASSQFNGFSNRYLVIYGD
ncbi:Mitochondrial 2-oxoadipate and 2-oxoglutarate transporter [Aspergillus nanangensis]|uniref:Mitochondrial 2-oxoadipate and 2-oxoglutarate transporter n=1 Tax=Aspergillus nanangensis TaxID=2582783 RepID=A0AAD4CWF6_ASPNN|nr:Mitochondrial 2-oxoadipate and 2-oxoglutarate transporter [Aspergillus nanangensis]